MDAQRRFRRIILGLAMSGCAGCAAAATSSVGIAAAADAPPARAAAPYKHRQHVNLHGWGFAYGDSDAAHAYLKRIYPEGLVTSSDVVADLKRAGATCDSNVAVVSCSYDDSFFRDDSLLSATWTVRVTSRPDGALAKIDVTQSLRE